VENVIGMVDPVVAELKVHAMALAVGLAFTKHVIC
jgi:hypothetical protein